MTSEKAAVSQNKPQVGQTIRVYNQICRIIKVRAFGTVDCISLDGLRAFRVSGLNFI